MDFGDRLRIRFRCSVNLPSGLGAQHRCHPSRQSAVEPLFCNFDFRSAGAIRFIPGELCAVFSIPPLGSFFHRRLGRGFRPPLPDSILILRHRQTGITARHRISFGGIVRRQTFLRFWFSLGWRYAIHSRRVIRSFSTFPLGSFFPCRLDRGFRPPLLDLSPMFSKSSEALRAQYRCRPCGEQSPTYLFVMRFFPGFVFLRGQRDRRGGQFFEQFFDVVTGGDFSHKLLV